MLLRVAISAFLSIMGPKKGEQFLREMGELLASEEAFADVLPIRPQSWHEEVTIARRGAMALFRAHLPTFMARMKRR